VLDVAVVHKTVARMSPLLQRQIVFYFYTGFYSYSFCCRPHLSVYDILLGDGLFHYFCRRMVFDWSPAIYYRTIALFDRDGVYCEFVCCVVYCTKTVCWFFLKGKQPTQYFQILSIGYQQRVPPEIFLRLRD
jgi:hypothetical protein